MPEHFVTYVRRVWVPHSFEKAKSVVSRISGQDALVFGEMPLGAQLKKTGPLHALLAYERVAGLPKGRLGEWPQIVGPAFGVANLYREAEARAEAHGFIAGRGCVNTPISEAALRSHRPCPLGQEPTHPKLSPAYEGLLKIGMAYRNGIDEPARMIPGPTSFFHPFETAANFASMPFRAPQFAKVLGTLFH